MASFNFASFDVIFPMLGIIGTGWVVREFDIIGVEAVKHFEDFVFLVSLPALIFYELASFDTSTVNFSFLLSILTGMIVVYFATIAMCYYFARRQYHNNEHLYAIMQTAIDGISAGQPSAIFLGYPLIKSLFGTEYTVYCALVSALAKLTIIPICIVTIDICKLKIARKNNLSSKEEKWWIVVLRATKKMLLNAIILPVILGLIWSALKIKVPVFLQFWVEIVGNAAPGTALFLIGLSIYGKEIVGPNWAEITITIIMKQLVLPIITVVLLSLSKVDYQLIKVAYILTMLPPSQTNIFFAKYADKVGVSIVESTVILGGLVAIPNIALSFAFLNDDPKHLFVPHDLTVTDLDILQEGALIIGIFSMIACIWLMIPLLLNPQKRSSDWLVLFLSVSQFLFAFSQTWGQGGEVPKGALCSLQGFVIQLSGTMSFAIMFLIVINAYLILKNYNPPLMVYAAIVVLFSGGTSFAVFFFKGYTKAGPWCWIDDTYIQFGVFYGPAILFFAVSLICLQFFNSTVTEKRRERIHSRDTVTENSLARLNLKIRIFAIIFIFLWLWGVLNRVLIGIFEKPIFIVFLLQVLSTSLTGAITFLIWGLNEDITGFYKRLYWRFIKKKRPTRSMSVISTDSAQPLLSVDFRHDEANNSYSDLSSNMISDEYNIQ